MPETVAVAIAEAFAAVGAETIAVAIYTAPAWTLTAIAVAVSVYTLRDQQRKQQNAARDAYNNSLQDRYVMMRGATTPRQVVLGRQRVSGPIPFLQSYGADRASLAFVLLLAAHEIDAVEAIYINDELAIIDGAGNVTGVNRRDQFAMSTSTGTFTLSGDAETGGASAAWVDYGSTRVALTITSFVNRVVSVSGGTAGLTGTVTIQYKPSPSPWLATTGGNDLQATITLDGSGNGSVVLPTTPASIGTVAGGTVDNMVDVTPYAGMSGSTVTVTSAPAGVWGRDVVVTYRAATANNSRMRIRTRLGAPGQAADAGLIAELPGVWTSAHTLTGQAYLVIEGDFSPDAFPSGLPNISAVVRGAKCYDPRTGATAWTENPAILARYVATSSLLGRLGAAMVNDTSIAAAANVCDASATYIVNGQAYTRAMYTAGTVVKSGTPAKAVLDDLCTAMVGRWCLVDGQLRLRAGAYTTPLQTLDDSWLSAAQPITVQRQGRQDTFNTVSGKFVDELRDYQQLDYPTVTAAAYVTEDGTTLPIEIPLNCVSFSGQAQQVVAAMMRDARQGLHLTLTCNMRAYPVEVFDVLLVNLARFGWTNKAFEVLDVSWTLDGGITLQLKETDPSIWQLGTSFAATDPAPNTLLPNPWYVPAVASLACASGTSELQRQADGTITATIKTTWAAITDKYVTESGGGVEVLYGLATTPESQWRSVLCPNGTSLARLADVQDGALYLIKARAYTMMVKGAWCPPVLHRVVGKTAAPANVSGLTATIVQGGVRIDWAANTELDYAQTELRIGAPWGSATLLFKGASTTYTWPWPSVGTYTIAAKHRDTTGNESTTAATVSATVDSGMFVQWANINGTGKAADNATVNRLTYGVAAPSSPVDGDVWVDDSASPAVIKLRVSGAWQAGANLSTGALAQLNSVDTAQISANAATELSSDSWDFAGTAYGSGSSEIVLRTLTVSTTAASTVDFTAIAVADGVNGDSGRYVAWYVNVAGGPDVLLGAADQVAYSRQSFAAVSSFGVGAAVSLQFQLRLRNALSGGSPMHVFNTGMRVIFIKR